MPQSQSANVRECLEQADALAQRARAEPDPAVQCDLIEMERCWLQLARSYETFEQLQSLSTSQEQLGKIAGRLDDLKRELTQPKMKLSLASSVEQRNESTGASPAESRR
jgi:hypothetical protein